MNDWPETNESLILRVKDPADGAAWSAFLAIYRAVVFRLARSRGLQDADADDLAQQVFVAIARSVESWTPTADGPPFRAWLYRIAHNEILKAITRRKPDAAAGSSSVQEMLQAVPQHDSDASVELMREGRMEAFRWASDAIRHKSPPQHGPYFGSRQSKSQRSRTSRGLTVEAAEPSTWRVIA